MSNEENVLKLITHLQLVERNNENHIAKHMEIISASFSAVGTANPRMALSILEQMNEQKGRIEELAKQHEDLYAEMGLSELMSETGDDDTTH